MIVALSPNRHGTRTALPQATIQHGPLTCLLTNILCKKLLARLLSVLCSEHPDFPEPVAQLRSLPISIFIHPLFERAIPTRLQLLSSLPTLPYPGNSPLYSLSLTPLSLKVPAPPISHRKLRPRPQTSRFPSPSIPYSRSLIAFTIIRLTPHCRCLFISTAIAPSLACATWQLKPGGDRDFPQLRINLDIGHPNLARLLMN